ncbi:translation initiation factor SUI1 domain-containing protein [Phthorimaea operculella]|nr:translation initiation factor SUI1 domain-containing protein [Phthorimaea operculella]
MDGLLSFLRLHGKNAELPILTSLLYRNHMMPMCPPDRTLDVKKSSYKKMGKFMEAMQREGFLTVKEMDKGVDAVVAVNLLHPIVRAHKVPTELKERLKQAEEAEKEPTEYVPPLVREMLCVTAKVNDFFPAVKKGTPLTASEVRAELTEYVKLKNLNNTQQKGTVILDALLAKVLGKQENECVKWDALMLGVTSHMTAATELRWPDGENKLIKSKLEPITMQVVKRSGNKKVTLVNNLEAYGFHLPALATACQHGVGASCGVTRSPGAKNDQLMLQGDQVTILSLD